MDKIIKLFDDITNTNDHEEIRDLTSRVIPNAMTVEQVMDTDFWVLAYKVRYIQGLAINRTNIDLIHKEVALAKEAMRTLETIDIG